MYVFGEIDKSSTIIKGNIVYYTQNFTSASNDVNLIKILSGSSNTDYWKSLNVLFYTSGSPQYDDEHKFAKPSNNLSLNPTRKTQYLTKYHGYPSSSLISIPQQYYGEKIKEEPTTFGKRFNPTNELIEELNGLTPLQRDALQQIKKDTGNNASIGNVSQQFGNYLNSGLKVLGIDLESVFRDPEVIDLNSVAKIANKMASGYKEPGK